MSQCDSIPCSLFESKRLADARDQVLVADDDPIYRAVLKRWLEEWGYNVTLVADGAEAWKIMLRETAPELLILDWVMPKIDGTELCRRIRQRERIPCPYILLVTAKDETQDVVIGLEAGANDYLTKPFDRSELRARLNVGKRILRLQQELIQAREELRYRATHDVLTGLWNRGAVLEMLHRELERGARSGTATAVLMLDLDHFKLVNDTHGHLEGDAVLRQVARRMLDHVRAYDFVGRYGGEEFLIVLPGCDRAQVQQSAERIRRAVAGHPLPGEKSEIPLTVSIGATVANHGESEEAMLTAADAALYQAKLAGRNQVVIL
jgi:two-component system, cell cycle response regulator